MLEEPRPLLNIVHANGPVEDDLPLIEHRPLIEPVDMNISSLYALILQKHEDDTRVTRELQISLLHRLRNHTTALLNPISLIQESVKVMQDDTEDEKKFRITMRRTFILSTITGIAGVVAIGLVALLISLLSKGLSIG